VLFFDVDNFNEVNDSLGHGAGDELLVALTARLSEEIRPTDTFARFGGDEFVVLCEDLTNEAGAISVAERIAAALEDPIAVGEREHFVSVSIGIVVVDRRYAVAADVLRDADAAMYRAKARGKGCYEVYDGSMRARLLERLTLERELRRGIDSGELRLLYQPIVLMDDGRVVGAEALVRWQHPTRGLLTPESFIAIAEHSGAITALGKWVIEHALRQNAAWAELFPSLPLAMSVNLSARQVAPPGLPGVVREALRSTGANPERVALEITESALIEATEAAAETLNALKALGVALVLDDFGTGYSSLSYLKRFPIDAIKIDRSFVTGLDQDTGDTAIIAALISMANALGIGATAEGIENAAQAAALSAQGCQLAQGYHYSRPLAPEAFTELIATTASVSPIRAT
jgi:diguanylate cyclase (GGDEF)-like protein